MTLVEITTRTIYLLCGSNFRRKKKGGRRCSGGYK